MSEAGWTPRDDGGAAPLAGIRVLDFSELLPGPFLTQNLVELGAEVLKIERPPHGDPVRRSAPALFEAVNRGKRSLQLDLKDAPQRAQALALADEADVLVESFRPGVMARLGLGPEALLLRNPALVYVSLSGYGADGPRAQWPGHDINYLATAGIVALAQKPGQVTPGFGVPMADLAGSVYALAALNAALLQRTRSGRGQWLDVSLTDCAAHWMNPRLALLHEHGGDAEAMRAHVQARPGYGVFRCRDGLDLSVAALEDHFWRALLQALPLDLPATLANSRYRERAPHAAAVNAALAAALAGLDRAEALQRLLAADVPVAEVELPQTLAAQPQLSARGLFVETRVGPMLRWPVRILGQI